MSGPQFKAGQLVKLAIKNRCYTDDGLQTVGTYNVLELNSGLVYSKIDISSYPSCSDFFGETTRVSDGDLATVVSYVGRPFKIQSTSTWEQYDIYEILIFGHMRHIFSYNLEPSSEYFKKI